METTIVEGTGVNSLGGNTITLLNGALLENVRFTIVDEQESGELRDGYLYIGPDQFNPYTIVNNVITFGSFAGNGPAIERVYLV